MTVMRFILSQLLILALAWQILLPTAMLVPQLVDGSQVELKRFCMKRGHLTTANTAAETDSAHHLHTAATGQAPAKALCSGWGVVLPIRPRKQSAVVYNNDLHVPTYLSGVLTRPADIPEPVPKV